MILPDLILPSRVNQHWQFSGMDHIDWCLDKSHFLSYTHNIEYQYNSRGFRDQEWPDNAHELRDAIWCIGDSFTVGLGSPIAHTWPFQLSKVTNRRVINVSMDGASNEWIARITEKIVRAIDPAQIVIMWSYIHRREHPDTSIIDEDRKIHHSNCTEHDDWMNFLDCKKRVDSITNSVQFAIPFFRPSQQTLLSSEIITNRQLASVRHKLLQASHYSLPATITQVRSKDIARDGHHFDLITAEWVATQAAFHLC